MLCFAFYSTASTKDFEPVLSALQLYPCVPMGHLYRVCPYGRMQQAFGRIYRRFWPAIRANQIVTNCKYEFKNG